MYHHFGTRRFKLITNVFLDSTCKENVEGKAPFTLTCIDNHFNELRCQVLIVALIKRIDNDDHTFKFSHVQRKEGGVRHSQHRLDHELFKLVVEWFLINRWVALKDLLNQGFGSGNGMGKLMSECRNQVVYDASISSSSTEEEAGLLHQTLVPNYMGTHLAASWSLASHRSAMVHAIADFPAPAGPLSQQTSGSVLHRLRQSIIVVKSSSRVPSMHLAGCEIWLYAAPSTGLSKL